MRRLSTPCWLTHDLAQRFGGGRLPPPPRHSPAFRQLQPRAASSSRVKPAATPLLMRQRTEAPRAGVQRDFIVRFRHFDQRDDRADAGTSIRREIAGKRSLPPISTCQSKPIGTTKRTARAADAQHLAGRCALGPGRRGPSPCITKSMTLFGVPRRNSAASGAARRRKLDAAGVTLGRTSGCDGSDGKNS